MRYQCLPQFGQSIAGHSGNTVVGSDFDGAIWLIATRIDLPTPCRTAAFRAEPEDKICTRDLVACPRDANRLYRVIAWRRAGPPYRQM